MPSSGSAAPSSVTVELCKFRDSGGNAIRMDLHARQNRISTNEIRHMGQGGILLIGYGPGTKDVNDHNEIVNNNIHHSGLIYWHSHAIVLWQSGSNRVAHNYIHHMPRKAVCLGGPRARGYLVQKCTKREICGSVRWHEVGGPKTWDESMPFLHTRNNLVEYNEIERVVQKLGDGSTINVSGAGEGNTIRRNYIHDIYGSEFVDGCLRTDDQQRGVLWEENVIQRANIGGWQHKGRNKVVNNFTIDVSPVRYFRTYKDPVDGSVIEKNIFYSSTSGANFFALYLGPDQLATSRVEGNLYFHAGGPAGTTPEFLSEMRKRGVCKSDAYQDPMFTDLTGKNFTFQPGSPVWKLGIKPIDLRSAGLLKEFPAHLLN